MNTHPPAPEPAVPDRLLQIQAWIDGELPPSEALRVQTAVAGDPSAQTLAANLRALQHHVRGAEPILHVPETREFYFSRIARAIEQEERSRERLRTESAHRGMHLPYWLRWALPAAGLVAALAFFLRPPDNHPVPVSTIAAVPTMAGHEVDAIAPEMTTLTFYSARDAATVVWVSNADIL